MVTGFSPVTQTAEKAVLWTVSHYFTAEAQLAALEKTRWRHVNAAQISENDIRRAAQMYGTAPEAVAKITAICLHWKSVKTLTRREITNITGLPAMPIMKAVSDLFKFPYSLRGLTPARMYEKGAGCRGHPVYMR